MTLVWVLGVTAGLVVASAASRRAVVAALAASQVARVSPALIGITVMAIGTDLPEIASSVAAAVTGHGDVAVGDSAGSALTQVTLVLAILCFATRSVSVTRHTIGLVGALTVAALALDALLVRDGLIDRWEGLLLIGLWVGGLLGFRQIRSLAHDGVIDADAASMSADRRRAMAYVARATAWLVVVAVAATVVVQSFVQLTEDLGVPELVASAIVLALGTSLPELLVDLTALRQGAAALAIGDLFGSSLVDATFALGSGPAIRAMVVSPEGALTCLIAAAGIALATIVATRRPEHGRRSGVAFLAIYLASTAALLAFTA